MTLFEWAVVLLLANIGWALWRIKVVLAKLGLLYLEIKGKK